MGIFKKLFGSNNQPPPEPPAQWQPAAAPVVPPALHPVPQPTQQLQSVDELLQDVESAIKAEPPVRFSVKITTGADTVDLSNKPRDVEQIPELSRLDFGKAPGVLGCYLNYQPSHPEPPLRPSVDYIQRHGMTPPAGITREDADCIIKRMEHEYDREGPESWLVDLAFGLGLHFSAFIGGYSLFKKMITEATDKNRAALYAYAVRQSIAGQPFGNMLADPLRDRFYAFADVVAADASLLKSLKDRQHRDYREPQKNTKIYKAAAAFLAGSTP